MLLTWQAAEPGVAIGTIVPTFPVGVEFDASMQETLSFSSPATRHPVEDGTDITDHVNHEPDVLTLSGLITNAPTSQYDDGNYYGPIVSAYLPKTFRTAVRRVITPGTVRGFWNAPFIPPGAPPRAFNSPGVFVPGESVLVPETYSHAVLQALQPVDRVQKVIELLRAAQKTRAVIRVEAKHAIFERMLITALAVPAMNADAVEISITLQVLETAKVGFTTVVPKKAARKPAKPRDEKKVDAGPAAEGFFAGEEQRDISNFARLGRFFGGAPPEGDSGAP